MYSQIISKLLSITFNTVSSLSGTKCIFFQATPHQRNSLKSNLHQEKTQFPAESSKQQRKQPLIMQHPQKLFATLSLVKPKNSPYWKIKLRTKQMNNDKKGHVFHSKKHQNKSIFHVFSTFQNFQISSKNTLVPKFRAHSNFYSIFCLLLLLP